MENIPASTGLVGFAYTEFKGKPESPGISNFEIAREYISFVAWAWVAHFCNLFKHSVIYNVI